MFVTKSFPARWIAALITAFLVVGLFYSGGVVHAAQPLEAQVLTSTSVTMAPGEVKEVLVEFKNTGTQTWKNDGPGYVSLYTHGPKYRRSSFDPGTWLWSDQVKRIREESVAPGKSGTMVFELKAPATAGSYKEVFHLASEDTAWISGGELSLNITVGEGVAGNAPVASAPAASAEGLNAEVIVKSANLVKANAGRSIAFTVAFKNTGTKTWSSYGLQRPEMAIAAAGVDFSHPSWSGATVASVSGANVAPGGTAIVNFAFNAPKVDGTHTARFQLQANGVDVPGGDVDVPVEVIGGTPAAALGPVDEPADVSVAYIDEPAVRIGVLIVDEETDNKVVITSVESDVEVRDTAGGVLATIAVGKTVTAYYGGGKYYFDVGAGPQVSSLPLRFAPVIEDAPLRIANWDKRITRGSTYADNEFRNILEFRYNAYKDRSWIINELGLESYLLGLAETSDYHQFEFNKAQATAARSYAYFHIVAGGKRPQEFMDLNSSPSDQYYLGYGREKRAPGFAQAARDTSGAIVTYEGKPAITPYYARSNGSTKNWSSVWWGDRPHAKAVPVPCDVGKTQWGHGVGMPQSGAECMAKEGKLWHEILTYFYTGVEVVKLWE